MRQECSDYIIYVDESGDHGLASIDPQYPIFVLAFCIFKKQDYLQTVQAIQAFKFDHFGHDMVVLHESEIRRDRGPFSALKTKALKTAFMQELGDIIEAANFTVITAVIDKSKLTAAYRKADNPYHIALGFCMERAYRFLRDQGQEEKTTHIICERRGLNEDNDLELAFRRINDGNNFFNQALPFDIVMAHKQCNSTGLQFADLLARPIGLSVIKPEQPNRAFEIIQGKLRCYEGRYEGFGLKVFPS